MDAGSAPTIEKLPADFMHHPYELYARLRAAGPAREVVMPHGVKVWMVTRYDDVRAILADPRISKDGRRINELYARHSGAQEEPSAFDDELSAHLLNSDPPRHERLRRLVSRAFTARRVEQLRPRVEQIADELLDRMDGQRADLISDYAIPLPITVITDLLGVPAADREAFRLRANTLVGSHHSPEEVAEASAGMIEYTGQLIEAKRADPGDDLLSALTQAGDDGDVLTQGELVAMAFLLVAAGHETTTSTFGNALHSLLTHPRQLARLGAEPGLVAGALDELFRYDGGVSLATFRFTREAIALGGVTIPAGEIVVVSVGSAGRDGNRFSSPDTLDITRQVSASMAFGHGIHYCLGAQLGKVEVEVGIRRLLARFPQVRLAVEPAELPWKSSTLMHGLLRLPVTLTS